MKKIRAKLWGENAVVEIIAATCNICNASCMKDDGIVKEFEGVEINADWGYYSGKDGERWRAVVCEECADKYLKPLVKFDISEK